MSALESRVPPSSSVAASTANISFHFSNSSCSFFSFSSRTFFSASSFFKNSASFSRCFWLYFSCFSSSCFCLSWRACRSASASALLSCLLASLLSLRLPPWRSSSASPSSSAASSSPCCIRSCAPLLLCPFCLSSCLLPLLSSSAQRILSHRRQQ